MGEGSAGRVLFQEAGMGPLKLMKKNAFLRDRVSTIAGIPRQENGS
jgi:hypothetical protein